MSLSCSVVVPNYNGEDLLPRLLASLDEQFGLDLEISIVDNGSTDQSRAAVPESVRWIQLDHNYGFAYAANRGMEAASNSFIFLVNSDMALETDCLTRLVSFLNEYEEYGFVQPKVRFLNRKDTINTVGDIWSVYGLAVQKGFGEKDAGQFDHLGEIFSPTGGAVLYRKSMLEDIGLFDERFVSYLEDVDLGFRMRLAGYRGALVPEAVIYHKFQATFSRIPNRSRFYITRNSYFVAIKNLPIGLFVKYLPQLLTGMLRVLIVYMKDRHMMILLKIKISLLKNLFYLLRERQTIQRKRKISNHELEKWFLFRRPFPILFWKKG